MFWGMRNLPETLLRCFDSCKYPKSKMAAKMAAVFYILIIIFQPYAGNTSKVSKHMFWVMNYLLKTLLQRFGSCKYPKSKMAAVWRARWRPKWPSFSYFDHNFLTIHTRNTSKVSKHMFWGIRNLPETLLRCFDSCKYPKSKMAAKMAAVFYILITTSQPYMLETQVRYPNMCFEVWTIYLKHYYNVLAYCKYPKSKMTAVWCQRWRPKWPFYFFVF